MEEPMDINYELYKVFYYVAKTLSFFRSVKKAVYFPVRCQSVDQSAGKKAGTATFYPKYQTGKDDAGRRNSV